MRRAEVRSSRKNADVYMYGHAGSGSGPDSCPGLALVLALVLPFARSLLVPPATPRVIAVGK
jgi:hypothetical protein